jgi:hypothetical protein
MEKIIECLENIDYEYETRTQNLKNKISANKKSKLEHIDENDFLINLIELKKHIKKINNIDIEAYKKLDLLRGSWIEDYNKIYHLHENNKKKLFGYSNDKIQAYFDDLEMTTDSIKKVTNGLKTKVISLQIQDFLKSQSV